MPFAVFRRHQRKLLAIFAILAMLSFVVADSLPRLLSGSPVGGGNPVVVDLYGKSIRRSDVQKMQAERIHANQFMFELTGILARRPVPNFFGETNTKAIVDALILEHEADRLGMPAGPEVARDWLKQRAGAGMTRELFDLIHSRFDNRVSGEQLLTEISNQIRLGNVRSLMGAPTVTPLDVFQTYRDQNERVAARVAVFPVEDFLSKVSDPTSVEVQAYYDKYKNTLPDPDRPTPGFKVPRRIEVEILSLDGEALAKSIKDKLTDAEIQTYYENRKAEFKKPSELPEEIFQDRPDLTPPVYQSLADLRPYLSNSLAEDKAQNEIVEKFGRIKDKYMIPFADKYLAATDEIAEAKKSGSESAPPLPKFESLAAVAKAEGLEHETTKPLTRNIAEKYGLISGAEVGLTRMSGGRKFAEELFDSKSSLFEPLELTDFSGRRFLTRKIQDQPPRVPSLDEIRSEVILAWKTEKARPLAKKAAEQYAEKVKAAGGKIVGEIVDGHPVINTDPITKLQPGLPIPGQFFETGPPTPTEIPQISAAGQAFRDAYFGLTSGSVAVAPNQPETIYYTLALNMRVPASFAVLYAPNGDYFRYKNESLGEAFKRRDEEWMKELRAQAKLSPDWTPSDESRNAADDSDNS